MALWAVLLQVGMSGCGQERSPAASAEVITARTLPLSVAAGVDSLVRGHTQFACDSYRRLTAHAGNLFFSPFSVSVALAMVHTGARGRTAQEIAAALRLPRKGASTDRLYRELLESLDRGSESDGYQLKIADGLWVQRDYALLPSFTATVRDDYRAASADVDFTGAPEDARSTINTWVAEHTAQKITEVFPSGSINKATRLALVSAIYFKGRWAQPFDRRRTMPRAFQITASETVSVPTMSLTDTFPCAQLEDLSIVELPYGAGDIAMDVIVPHAVDGLTKLDGRVTPKAIAAWIENLHVDHVYVQLPRFVVRTHVSLQETLRAMGMPTMFASDADLGGVTGDTQLFLQAAEHEAVIEVDEEGTEAAAATGVSAGMKGLTPSVVADHPFLFLIRDRVTGSILFMGRVANPAI